MWMIRRHHGICHTKNSIHTSRVDSNFFGFIIRFFEFKLTTHTFPNPISLHFFHTFSPIKFIKIINQSFSIISNFEHPLAKRTALNERSTSLARIIRKNFLIGKPCFARWTIIDRQILLICQPFFKKLQKNPLRPFVVFWISRIHHSFPIITKPKRLKLLDKCINIFGSCYCWMCSCFDSKIFCWKPKCIKSDWVQNIETLRMIITRNNICRRITLWVTHMKACTRWIRKHVQNIFFWLVREAWCCKSFIFFPEFLPLGVKFFVIKRHRKIVNFGYYNRKRKFVKYFLQTKNSPEREFKKKNPLSGKILCIWSKNS